MSSPQIRFEDGAAYEPYMGVWSRDVGEAFLRWLAPAPGWRWADVGCGNGAFTELLVAALRSRRGEGHRPGGGADRLRLATASPNEARVAFEVGDAQALPWAEAAFDAGDDGPGDLLRARPREERRRDGTGAGRAAAWRPTPGTCPAGVTPMRRLQQGDGAPSAWFP